MAPYSDHNCDHAPPATMAGGVLAGVAIRDIRLQLGRALRFVDGAPDIDGLPCDALRTDAGDYMRRYHIEYTAARSIRFHHFVGSDPGRDLHDHPWDFASVLLQGTYTEHTPDGPTRYEAPCVLLRKAEQLHRLELTDGPAWTYIVTGRVRRHWGFQTEHGWVRWSRHTGSGTVAACEPPRW